MADTKLDEAFGVKPAAPAAGATPPAQEAPKKMSPLDPAGLGAKLSQSATFGFGADVAGAIFGKQAEETTRALEKQYDKDNPFWSFGIDLAVGAVESSVIPGAAVAKVPKLLRAAGGGALYGALTGAGSGGSVEERAKKAGENALIGGALGGAATGIGKLLEPGLDRMGKMGYNQGKKAFDMIQAALKSDGKTTQELESFMRQNPNARIADFSPKVADLVGEMGGLSNPAARQLGTNIREDTAQQLGRLQNPSQPLMHVKQQYAANLDKLQQDMQKAYKSAYSEVTPLTPELKAALDHPDVKPLVQDVLDDYRKLRMNPSSAPGQAPKYKVGAEIPTAVVDDLQKRIGFAAKDPANIGTLKAGAFQTAQSMLKDAQPASLDAAQRIAATVGGEASETGIIGAQTWGSQFAMGLKSADKAKWDQMNPLERQYARIGMVDGMERFLRDKGQMGEGALTKLAEKMDDPQVRDILGAKEANQVKKVFKTEAARQRTNVTMASGGSKRAQFQEENMGRAVAHMANVGIPGAHSVVGTAMRVLRSVGVPESRAKLIIDTATKPGGLAKLQKMGLDRNTLDKLAAAITPAQVGRAGAELQDKSQ